MYITDSTQMSADERAKRPALGAIYRAYCARCRHAGAMDFDDLLYYTNVLLRDNPDIRRKYQEYFEICACRRVSGHQLCPACHHTSALARSQRPCVSWAMTLKASTRFVEPISATSYSICTSRFRHCAHSNLSRTIARPRIS